MFTDLEVLSGVHFVTIYTKVGPKLSNWLTAKGVTDDEWLKWCLRDRDSKDFTAIVDELEEAATAAEVLVSPILEVERYIMESTEKVELLIERRKLVLTSRPKHYASSELISRFISKWFEILDKEAASDLSATRPTS